MTYRYPSESISICESFSLSKAHTKPLTKLTAPSVVQLVETIHRQIAPVKEICASSEEISRLFSVRYTEYRTIVSALDRCFIAGDYIVYDDRLLEESISAARAIIINAKQKLLKDNYQPYVHGQLKKRENLNVNILAGRYLYTHNHFSNNYFHWHIQTIGGIWLAKKELAEQHRILFPNNLAKWQLDSLQLYGVRDEEVLWYDPEENVLVDEIIYPSMSWLYNHGGVYGMPVDFLKSFRTKSIACSANEGDGQYPQERLYLSRFRQRRNLVNEEEVCQALKALDFKIIQPETLNFYQQVELFSKAKVVVSAPGAALTNLLYMKEGGCVIELMSNDFFAANPRLMTKWSEFARALDLHSFVYVDGSRSSEKFNSIGAGGVRSIDSWRVDIDSLVKFVSRVAKQNCCGL